MTAVIALAACATLALATLAGGVIGRLDLPLVPRQSETSGLDGLRGYLAVCVFLHHGIMWINVTRGGDWTAPAVPFFNELGQGAVALFFMITGFLFYKHVRRGFLDTAWPQLYLSRLFRIMPILIVSVALCALLASVRTGHRLAAADVPALLQWIVCWEQPPLAGLPDSGRLDAWVLWSLRMEWLFYLAVLPVACILADLLRRHAPTIAVPILLLVAATALAGLRTRMPLIGFLPFFAVGMLAQEASSRAAIAVPLRSGVCAVVACAGLLLACSLLPLPRGPALLAFAFFFLCVACGNDLFGLLRSRGALIVGEASFSLYLLHGILLSLFFNEGEGIVRLLPAAALPAVLPLLAVVAVAASCLTYLLVERPLLRAGRRVAQPWANARLSRLRPSPAPLPAASLASAG